MKYRIEYEHSAKDFEDVWYIEKDYLEPSTIATVDQVIKWDKKNGDIHIFVRDLEKDNTVKNELIKHLKLETTISSFACSGIDSRVSLNSNDLTKIHVRYDTKEEARTINEFIIKNYSDKISSFLVCKEEAIEIVSKVKQILLDLLHN